MDKKILVSIEGLSQSHRERIVSAATKNGYEVFFSQDKAEAEALARDAEIIFSFLAELSLNAPKLRWMCTPSAGINHFVALGNFPVDRAMLSNSSGAYGLTIAEHIVMVMLSLLRRADDYAEIVNRREWRRDLDIQSIYGSRITMLGTGDIGTEAVKRLRAFGPKSINGVNRSGRNPQDLYDKIVTIEHLDDILPETDILVMSLPSTPDTHHIMNEHRFSLLPEKAVIINVGRGNAIDEKSLLPMLQSGRLRAALDVFEQEPLPVDSPLWDCPNLLITPHASGNTTLPHTLDRIVEMFLEDFERYCTGKPLLRQVNLNRGY
ncbi:MAG: D-2-hydroxyacid dehydrogenase [Eubacteriales bacterium]|nr:D-2-hydroxyacid dehydrogenase [Eubacteriales bacterium]